MSFSRINPLEIWLVKSDPSVGREYHGKRPAVVIQANWLPKSEGLYTVMLMSSYKERRWEYDILIPVSERNHLWKPTLVKVQHIHSFDRSRFLKKIGDLDSEWGEQIKAYLRSHFALS